MKNHLKQTGLSMTQAQSISNLCNQHAEEINKLLSGINNCQKIFKHDGEDYILQEAKPFGTDVVVLIGQKGELHALQAYLMHNIKAKDQLINNKKSENFVIPEDLLASKPEFPEYLSADQQPLKDENWAWDQLTEVEMTDYLYNEAKAAHYGQFIHKNGALDLLRSSLQKDSEISWIVMKEGEKTPVKSVLHHTSEDLLNLHVQISKLHREHEQKVNYYKAKVKNLLTAANLEITKENSVKITNTENSNSSLNNAYYEKLNVWNNNLVLLRNKFEENRLNDLKLLNNLKIEIPFVFQQLVNTMLQTTNEKLDDNKA
jgi:hypothetical protein